MQVRCGGFRYAFLQQQEGRLEGRNRLETALHGPVQQQAGQGQQAHALVVRHERAHHRITLAPGQACLGVVDRFVQAITAGRALGRQALQIAAGRLRLDHQRQGAGVRRNHGVLGQPALEAKAWNTERPILIIEVGVEGVVARLGHTPGDAQLVAMFDLQGHGRAAGLLQQRAFIAGHDQVGHQVFEHRSGPGQQHRHPAIVAEQASEGEPGLLRQLALGDDHEIGQAHFRREQVVIAVVQPAFVGVVADREQVALGIVEEGEVHARQ
ncbi:hypothetical protein D3C73_770120 [compost metagenome]